MDTVKTIAGNKLSLAIPLQKVEVTQEGKTREDYIVPADAEVRVNLKGMYRTYGYTPTVIDGNVVVVTDNGDIAVGCYAVEIKVTEGDGTPRRSQWPCVVRVYPDNTNVLDAFDDFPEYAEAAVLDAAVFYFAKGDKGDDGLSAYEVAVENGFIGTEEEWLDSLKADVDNVYTKDESDERYVQKVAGKGLSTNDYTTVEKQKLASLRNYDDTGLRTLINTKQDIIQDLQFIRNGAALGASAVQTERDPTVPSWAKQPTKPSYTASEVGALPSSTTIPTSLSQLSSDATHRTVTDSEKMSWSNKSNFSGNYNDLTNKPSFKTVNGESIIGTGDIEIEGGGVQSDWNETDTTDPAFIKNKPTIPDELKDLASDTTHRVVTDGEKAIWNSKQSYISDLGTIRAGASKGATAYQKPSTGIPSTDMSSDVQTSLGKADTALQSYTETDPTVPSWAKASSKPSYTASEVGALPDDTPLFSGDYDDLTNKPTIPVVPTNVSAFTNDAGYLTSHQDVSGKEDKVDIVAASGATLSAQVGKYYTLSNVGTLAITLPTIASGTTKVQTVAFYIAAGSSPAVTFTSSHTIIYPKDYKIEANGLYEIGAAWNGIGWVIGLLTFEIPT